MNTEQPGRNQKESHRRDATTARPISTPTPSELRRSHPGGVPIRFGNAPRWLPNLRGFAIFNEDFSLVKRTALGFREGATFELRMDAINLFNRTRLSDPATDASDPTSFGRIFGKSNVAGPRNIQVGARINF